MLYNMISKYASIPNLIIQLKCQIDPVSFGQLTILTIYMRSKYANIFIIQLDPNQKQ